MENGFEEIQRFINDVALFVKEFSHFIYSKLHLSVITLELHKSKFAGVLYKKRGKLARRFVHSGMAGLMAFGVMIAPVVAEELPINKPTDQVQTETISMLSASQDSGDIDTQISEKMRDKILEYTVQSGETVSTLAEKFGVSEDTIRWQNNLKSKNQIKAGQILQIPPVTGVVHKVTKGDTVYSIAKKYDTGPQGIVDFPYNTFSNDETFDLAVGQIVFVPDGVKKEEILWSPTINTRQLTPDAGTVVASGNFIWPTGGTITQRYTWYHKGLDIASRNNPSILAADAGRILVAGWPDNSGYGNRVIIDHGNGTQTLYAHMSRVNVVVGQRVNRGDVLGVMGSTGRSTGPHLHFEVITSGGRANPLGVLK